MGNSISYSEFEVLLSELSKRLDDYYGEGTFMGFKIRMESFISNFKSEYLKNFASLNRENKAFYIAHLNSRIEPLKEAFSLGDRRYLDILAKYKITEESLFNHTHLANELYQILTSELSTLKGLYKNSLTDNIVFDEVVDVLRIFYKQYSFVFTEAINNLVNGQPLVIPNSEPSKGSEVKKGDKSFGFPKSSEVVLKRIYYDLKLDSGDFINKLKTSVDDFVGLLTSKDFTHFTAEIHFECETTQVAYIISEMQKYSRDFTFKKISDSKKFYSKRGSAITETNLSKSKSSATKPKQAEVIDKFFADLVLKR